MCQCANALSWVCHCRTEIRPPPTQKQVSWELESRPQCPLLTQDAIHQRETTGSHQQPTVYPDNYLSAPNRFSCSDPSTRAGLTRTCVCPCKFTSLDEHGRLSGLRAGRCCSDSSRQACNSWPPFFNLITSYQSGAGGPGSGGSHIPAQLPTPSPPPPQRSPNISHSAHPHLIPHDTASCV